MPKQVTKTLFTFDELSDHAKEKARDWYREGALDFEWWDSVYDSADVAARLLGIEIDNKARRPGNRVPEIWFSGFACQGDGACFVGRYSYAKEAPKKIRAEWPKDEELHRIADELQALQRIAFYRLEAKVEHVGRYYHEHSTSINVYNSQTGDELDNDAAEQLRDLLRDFMRWIYRALEREHDWLLSDENVDETIKANEYTFTEEGQRDE